MSWTCVTFDRLSLSQWFYFGYSGSLFFFFAQSKKIQDSLELWIPHLGFLIPGIWFRPLSVNLGFWFQSLVGFRNPSAVFRIPKPWIPVFKDFEIQIPSSHVAIFWVMSHNVELAMCPLDPDIMPSPYYPFTSLSSLLSPRPLLKKKKRLFAGYVSLRLRF